MKEKILLVAKGGEQCDECFSYVLELAKSINADVDVLAIHPRQVMPNFEDVMIAAAFAEAGDFKTVRTLMDEQEKSIREATATKTRQMKEICSNAGIGLTVREADGDIGDIVREHVGKTPSVAMVLLSPSLSGNRKVLDIKRLLKNIPKPVVAISRPAGAEA